MTEINMNDKTLNKIKKIFKIIFYSFSVLFIAGGIIASLIIYFVSRDLPGISLLEQYKPGLITRLYDINGEVICEYYEEKRILVQLRKVPKHLIHGVIATEDANFYKHSGVNIKGIIRAILKDVISMSKAEGGSSITQQLAKNIFLSREKTITRKLKEILLSLQIEREYSKEEILEIYFNHIYFGSGAYGVEAASRIYFGKNVEDLNLEECAVLAGLPRAPNYYSPYQNIERSIKRRNWVLQRMYNMKYISKQETQEAVNEPIKLKQLESRINKAPYFNEYVRQLLISKYGDKTVYQEGLKVYTTLDLRLQKKAEEIMKEGYEKINQKVGAYKSVKFYNPIEILQRKKMLENMEDVLKELDEDKIVYGKITKVSSKEAVVNLGYGINGILNLDSMKWAKKTVRFNFERGNESSEATRIQISKVSDILHKNDLVRVKKRNNKESNQKNKEDKLVLDLIQEQLVQGALVCLDAQTGYIKAMVGGYDFQKTPFNRAYQAWRQPGSSFKPFIYTLAIDTKEFTPASIVLDAPVSYIQFKKWVGKKLVNVLWTPENYHKIYNGEVSVRQALALSLNIPSIKILEKIGTKRVIDFAHKIGLNSINNKNLSLALGTSEVTLLKLTSSFGMFANQGIIVEPMGIRYIEGNNGNIIIQYSPKEKVVLNEATNYIMTSLMESVIKIGTAKRVKALNRPIAGKTGTTDQAIDAWFVGFTPDIVTGIYFGLDDRTPMGQHSSGEELVVPYWTDFMQEALKDTNISSFSAPDSVIFLDIDSQSGMLATPECNTVTTEVFIRGTEPKEFCNKHEEKNLLENKSKFDLSLITVNKKQKTDKIVIGD
ncbi:MAG: PBP1A family penicillin-binding protein [Candidatus Firestonebacteria bacterium]|nr:PBP1A family penicillin-binding protein [Candidatus Firestonebacteria bacterium]